MGPVAAFRLTASAAYEIRIYLINNDFSKSISVTHNRTHKHVATDSQGHWDSIGIGNLTSLASSFYDIGQ